LKISDFQVHRFCLPLTRSIRLGQRAVRERKGLIAVVCNQNGSAAAGEVSPLPGFSRETADDAEEQLVRLKALITGSEIPEGLEALCGGFEIWLGELELAPSVRFGFEAAVLQLLAAERRVRLCELLCERPLEAISVNALLSGPQETVLAQAGRLLARGYTAFKLKVGREPVAQDIALVQHLAALLEGRAIVRLDANRAWHPDQALAFFAGVADVAIDYIEEPVRTFADLVQLLKVPEMTAALAIDESLRSLAPADLSTLSGIKAVVLKPTLLGFEKAMRFARAAHKAGMIAVMSSSFETGVGLRILAQMAAGLGGRDVPVGLDTRRWFASDLLNTSFEVVQGRLDIAGLGTGLGDIRPGLLEAVDEQ